MDKFTQKKTFEMQKGLRVSYEMDVNGRHRLVIPRLSDGRRRGAG